MATGDLSSVNVDGALLTASSATLYTIPASMKAVHIELHLCNTDPVTEYLPFIHFVPTGGSGSTINQVVNGVTAITGLRAGASRGYTWDQALTAGYMIKGHASAANKISQKLTIILEAVP